MIKREPYIHIWDSLSRDMKMVFVAGPRQVGKTTLARTIAAKYPNNVYFNWDILSHKKLFLEDPVFFQRANRADGSRPLVIFDEIHKYRKWKNYLKGVYDEFKDDYQFLVSGSGRLDIYQKGGDSLAGRYFSLHLFPFTVAELSPNRREIKDFRKDPLKGFDINEQNTTRRLWEKLSRVGGFPEPFVKGTETFLTRWTNTYYRQIVREDMRDVADIRRADMLELMFSLLPTKVGSPISMNNIARDIQASFDSVRSWLGLGEDFFLLFRIAPWTRKISRAISKEKKAYLYNYTEVTDPGARFENMAALELYRAVRNWNDLGLGDYSLHYIRNKEGEEVDFLIAERNEPVLLVETKLTDENASKSLLKYQELLKIPAVQLVQSENVYRHFKNGENGILVITAHRWLSSLP